ncbi:hypothetical protein JOE09_000851 [Pantoea coffeiphila]|nr:hypothetical protein [Pantoea coffeiphila]
MIVWGDAVLNLLQVQRLHVLRPAYQGWPDPVPAATARFSWPRTSLCSDNPLIRPAWIA